MPLGAQNTSFENFLFVISLVAVILGPLSAVVIFYPRILKWCLNNKWKFLSIPILVLLFGITTWQGFDKMFGFMPGFIKKSNFYQKAGAVLPGVGKEFMPSLDEGSYLYMPTTMPHASIGESLDVLQYQDKAINEHTLDQIQAHKYH